MRSLILVPIILLVGACSFEKTMAEHTIGYNRTVNEVGDAQMLLNILRSRDSRATSFVALETFTGNLAHSVGGNSSLSVPFGGDASREFPLGLSLTSSVSSSPVFSVQNLNSSQEFMNAMLDPVSMDVVKLFWDQGWPRDFLVYMVVESVELRVKRKKEESEEERVEREKLEEGLGFETTGLFGCRCPGIGKVVRNDPESEEHFGCFESFVRLVTQDSPPPGDLRAAFEKGEPGYETAKGTWEAYHDEAQLQLTDYEIERPIGPAFPSNDERLEFEHILEVKEKELRLFKMDSTYMLCDVRTETGFCFGDDSCSKLKSSRKKCTGTDVPGENGASVSGRMNTLSEGGSEESVSLISSKKFSHNIEVGVDVAGLPICPPERPVSSGQDGKSEIEVVVHRRSLQGMIYYLGEVIGPDAKVSVLTRASDINSSCGEQGVTPEDEHLPLFVLQEGPPQNASVAVDYDDGTYWIPLQDRCSRTQQSLSFLDQIFGIYKSRADLPESAPTVTIER